MREQHERMLALYDAMLSIQSYDLYTLVRQALANMLVWLPALLFGMYDVHVDTPAGYDQA